MIALSRFALLLALALAGRVLRGKGLHHAAAVSAG